MNWLLVLLCCLALLNVGTLGKKSPNILYIILDDWGYSDGWTHVDNDGDFDLSLFSELWSEEGLRLNSYYTNPTCAPTRSSFLSGLYSFKTGLVDPGGAVGKAALNLNIKVLTEYLQSEGYHTVLSGKWHVGHNNDSYHPMNRYFDEALYMSAALHTNQYNHTFCVNGSLFGMTPEILEDFIECTDTHQFCFYDLWNASTTHAQEDKYVNTYDTTIWTQYVMDFLDSYYEDSDSSSDDDGGKEPWFLYWGDNAPHSPVVEPPNHINNVLVDYSSCDLITNSYRKKFCKMLTYTENSIYNVILKLKELNAYKDTLIVVSSDNGGEPGVYVSYTTGLTFTAFGQSYPLRGSKFSPFEGGIRVPSFLTGGYLPTKLKGKEYNGLFHVVDWLPTILNIIGYDGIIDGNIDGINQWDNILNLNDVGRDEIAIIQYYVTNNAFTNTMLRKGDMKLIVNGGISGDYKDRYHVIYDGTLINETYISEYQPIMLFNITNDPYEYYDLSTSSEYASILLSMTERLKEIRGTQTNNIEPLLTKGQATYVYDNYRLDKQYGVLGPWRNDPYYVAFDNNAALTLTNIHLNFLNSDTCQHTA